MTINWLNQLKAGKRWKKYEQDDFQMKMETIDVWFSFRMYVYWLTGRSALKNIMLKEALIEINILIHTVSYWIWLHNVAISCIKLYHIRDDFAFEKKTIFGKIIFCASKTFCDFILTCLNQYHMLCMTALVIIFWTVCQFVTSQSLFLPYGQLILSNLVHKV